MTMRIKTMEFDTIIVTYNFNNQTMEIKPKPQEPGSQIRKWPEGEGITLPSTSWAELMEAFSGIGYEVPVTGTRTAGSYRS